MGGCNGKETAVIFCSRGNCTIQEIQEEGGEPFFTCILGGGEPFFTSISGGGEQFFTSISGGANNFLHLFQVHVSLPLHPPLWGVIKWLERP